MKALVREVDNTHLFGHDVVPCNSRAIFNWWLHPPAGGTRGHKRTNAIGQEWIGFGRLRDDGRDGLKEGDDVSKMVLRLTTF